jgi:uncharacterized protein YdcH (DUF465 family)
MTEITHRALFPTDRLGAATSLGGIAYGTERTRRIESASDGNQRRIRQLASRHSDYARQLDELESLPHLTEEQQLEETRLKKLKLRLKDQMEEMVRSRLGDQPGGATRRAARPEKTDGSARRTSRK